jgi:hypothetical protein
LVHVTGFTAAFLLTLPELFMQWRDQKDGDESNEKQYKILEFLGQQCHWPSFSSEKVRRTNSRNVTHGKGSMLSNAKAKSVPPYSFLPNVFDLKKVFKDCLDGSTQWETHSLCEDTKMIESSPRKRPADPAENQAEHGPSAKLSRRQLAEKGEDRTEESADGIEEKDSSEGGEGDTEKEPGDGSGEEESVDTSASSHGKAKQVDAPHEPGEVTQKIPRKAMTKRKHPEQENTEQEINPNPLVQRPHSGSDVTDIIQSLMDCVASHTFAEGDPINQHFDEVDDMLNTGNILMVFTRKNLGLPPQG